MMRNTTSSLSRPAGLAPAGYEWRAVLLLSLGFGLVNLDRFIIFPLFPVLMQDLQLNYQQLGLITAVLALTWGVASILCGRLGDRIGLRAVLWPSVLLFSLMAGLTGLAGGLASLLLVRGLMGAAEGAYTPTSVAATTEASHPSRKALNVGLLQMSAPLMGAGLAPLLATQLLAVLPSWRWVFLVVALPGLLVAYLIYRTIQDVPRPARPADGEVVPGVWQLLKRRNVALALVVMCGCLTSVTVLAAMMPNYLVDHLHLSMAQMGWVAAGPGVGGILGMVGLAALSDRLGRRKPVVLVSLLLALPVVWLMLHTGADPLRLFVLGLLSSALISGAIVVTIGPLLAASVPAGTLATASGLVIGLAEIIGGSLSPALAGALAQAQGIAIILPVAAVGALVAFVAALGLREPRP